jgi:hypothetical protein
MSEALQILVKSPWAQIYDERVHISSGPVNRYTVIVCLRSALPVRQALLRKKQIEMNYDKFTVADKTRFDTETREFLDCPDCAKYYIVTVRAPGSPASRLPNSELEMAFDVVGELKNLSLPGVKPYVTLRNDKGELRELVGFIPPKRDGGEALFAFPRFDNQGRPLVTMTNKKFYLQIDEKLFEGRSIPLKGFTFDVAPLTINNEVVF